ncbi:ephrin-B1 isoform X2 [Folsomia candida]|uniref:ephrin-B1 isoform X2 n=1 Tax=Folsomia candida TaxID=158441 RepID=UPI000B8FFE95|nr:ephrin-B1 isoform X2 [Folsomia candida]
MSAMALYFILLTLLLYVFDSLQETGCSRLPDIYWNATNPIFRIDNTDHIIDVNRDNLPYDQVNIICPVYAPGTSEEDAEKYIIYNVSKEEYDTCRITNPNPRIIAVCDKPHKLMYFTITFRSFTPQPGGLEFRPGQDYYFISTSSRDDLHRRVGGRCSTHNMKVVFKVCCHPGESSSKSTTTTIAPLIHGGAPRLSTSASSSSNSNLVPTLTSLSSGGGVLSSPTPPPRRGPVIVYTSSQSPLGINYGGGIGVTAAPTRFPLYHPTTRYPPKKNQYNTNPNVKPTSKKKELEKHQNEVVKNEELTSGATSSLLLRHVSFSLWSWSFSSPPPLLLCLVNLLWGALLHV